MTFWTDSRIATAKRLFLDENLSGEKVAQQIGASSRSVVLGFATRMGWTKGAPGRWSPERIEQARKLYIDYRLAASVVARMMDVGPRAIHGIAQRQGWQKRARGLVPKPKGISMEKPRALSRTPRAPTAAIVDPPSPCGVSLMDLKRHHCRWPIGAPHDEAFHLCGALAVGDGPYCGPHRSRAYQART